MTTPTTRQLTRVVTLSLALAFPAASAALAQQTVQPPPGGWYASVDNPHPELPGFPKIPRSDNRVYANTYNPRPEIITPNAGIMATTGGGAPLQPGAQVSQSK